MIAFWKLSDFRRIFSPVSNKFKKSAVQVLTDKSNLPLAVAHVLDKYETKFVDENESKKIILIKVSILNLYFIKYLQPLKAVVGILRSTHFASFLINVY